MGTERPNMVGRTLEQIVQLADLTGKVAIVTGATRGIGRETALALAKLGCNVVVAAKTTEPQPTLPGTIHTVAAEVEALGVKGLACRVDLRDIDSIQQCVEDTMAAFGRIDILINNASALWWQDIMDTPIKKYDLITSINARGTFFMTQACLPHMKAGGFGRIVNTSPPITLNTMGGHTAYNISKFGMTMVALGVSQEHGPESASQPTLCGPPLWSRATHRSTSNWATQRCGARHQSCQTVYWRLCPKTAHSLDTS